MKLATKKKECWHEWDGEGAKAKMGVMVMVMLIFSGGVNNP